jgi:omega-amidase
MSNSLSFALIQTDLKWEDKQHNLLILSQKIRRIEEAVDVIVLPEMFSTGFSMQPQLWAETMSGQGVAWLLAMAQEKKAVIVGSLIIEEAGKYYNRLLWVQPDGQIFHYDKRHLFSLAGEHHHYAAGNEKLIVEYKGWRIAPFVCYDLRFPTWCRNTQNYDIAIFVANWPHRRSNHWRALLPARAIENQAFVLAVNRVGYDGKDIYHSGYTTAIDADGQPLLEIVGEEKIGFCTLYKADLQTIRKRLPFLEDRDM